MSSIPATPEGTSPAAVYPGAADDNGAYFANYPYPVYIPPQFDSTGLPARVSSFAKPPPKRNAAIPIVSPESRPKPSPSSNLGKGENQTRENKAKVTVTVSRAETAEKQATAAPVAQPVLAEATNVEQYFPTTPAYQLSTTSSYTFPPKKRSHAIPIVKPEDRERNDQKHHTEPSESRSSSAPQGYTIPIVKPGDRERNDQQHVGNQSKPQSSTPAQGYAIPIVKPEDKAKNDQPHHTQRPEPPFSTPAEANPAPLDTELLQLKKIVEEQNARILALELSLKNQPKSPQPSEGIVDDILSLDDPEIPPLSSHTFAENDKNEVANSDADLLEDHDVASSKPQSQPKIESRPEEKPHQLLEVKPQSKIELESKIESQRKHESELRIEFQPKVKPQQKPESEAAIKSQPKTESDSKPQLQSPRLTSHPPPRSWSMLSSLSSSSIVTPTQPSFTEPAQSIAKPFNVKNLNLRLRLQREYRLSRSATSTPTSPFVTASHGKPHEASSNMASSKTSSAPAPSASSGFFNTANPYTDSDLSIFESQYVK